MGRFQMQSRDCLSLPVSAHSTCSWRRWMRWGTGLLRSEAPANRSPWCPHPWDSSPAYVSSLGHIQGVPVALGFGMKSILCVCVVGLPSAVSTHQTLVDDVINKCLV